MKLHTLIELFILLKLETANCRRMVMDNSYRIVQLLARPNLKIFSAQFCIPVFVNKWLCDSYLGREIQI